MLAILLTLSLALQDSGAFITRLGNDTLTLEQYARTPTRLRGEYLLRSPRSMHRIYVADLNPDGSIRRFEFIIHNIGAGPGPKEIKSTAEFEGDSVTMTFPQGDSTITKKVAAPRGAWPFQFYAFGLLEQMARWARGVGRDSVRFAAITAPDQLSGGFIRKRGRDTLALLFDQGSLAGVGPFTFRVDAQGRLTWLTGKGSTLQVDVARLASVPMAQATAQFANRPLGALSPRDTTRATIGGAEVWVDYSRPQRRGRVIFGNVVPWNTVWRTGANAATQLNTSADLVIGGVTVPAGKYTLWTLPAPDGWKLIINKQTGQWGTEYDAQQDLVRVDARAQTLANPVEQLLIAFEPGALTVSWDKTKVSVPVSRK